MGLNIVEQK